MGIFSRRTLQRLINENAAFVSGKLIAQQLRRLEAMESYLSAEWEIGVLNALSKLGNVEHEPNLGGSRKPDILYRSVLPHGQGFIADVLTVSDKGLDQKNPLREFVDCVLERARARGIPGNSFRFKVGDEQTRTPFGLSKSSLKLSSLKRLSESWLGPKFDEFLDDIVRAPDTRRTYPIRESDTDAVITYAPNQGFGMVEAADYTDSIALNDNPIFDRLCEKATQLGGAGDSTRPRGIFLCDGDCSLLRTSIVL